MSVGLFVSIPMIPQRKMLSWTKYGLSRWVYTFLLAALAIAALLMYYETVLIVFKSLSFVLLLLFFAVILMLAFTLAAMNTYPFAATTEAPTAY